MISPKFKTFTSNYCKYFDSNYLTCMKEEMIFEIGVFAEASVTNMAFERP